eukprot:scaffold12388_cov122-Isochrysis_galbana.AAC.13
MVAVRHALPARRIAAENGKEDLSQLPATLRGAACPCPQARGPGELPSPFSHNCMLRSMRSADDVSHLTW